MLRSNNLLPMMSVCNSSNLGQRIRLEKNSISKKYYSTILARKDRSDVLDPGHAFVGLTYKDITKEEYLDDGVWKYDQSYVSKTVFNTYSAWPEPGSPESISGANHQGKGVPTVNHTTDFSQMQQVINGTINSNWSVRTIELSELVFQNYVNGNDYLNTGCNDYAAIPNLSPTDNRCNCTTQAIRMWEDITNKAGNRDIIGNLFLPSDLAIRISQLNSNN
ncbi:MAG: hypothetical protein HC932_05560 [Thermales bacterium]|nr:hypothetical protein [Thermales bacterium]